VFCFVSEVIEGGGGHHLGDISFVKGRSSHIYPIARLGTLSSCSSKSMHLLRTYQVVGGVNEIRL
jgi:hypothetical protein